MKPSQKRALLRKLKAENEELLGRVHKLDTAVNDHKNEISDKQREMMRNQGIFMEAYSEYLVKRINDLEQASGR